MRSSSKEASYLRLVDFCITQLLAESNKGEEEDTCLLLDGILGRGMAFQPFSNPAETHKPAETSESRRDPLLESRRDPQHIVSL